ncbi:MAG: hypothetical protein ACFFC7_30055 [Candidatus Hermodarchaeota archaeon]
MADYRKFDELPYDFNRKRLSVLLSKEKQAIMITKGAVSNILSVCSLAEASNGSLIKISEVIEGIHNRYEEFSNKGFRTLGVPNSSQNRFNS